MDYTQKEGVYRAKDVITMVDDTVLFGFASGDMVSVQKSNDNYEPTSDAQGSASGSVKYDSLGTGAINLRSTNPLNKKFNDMDNNRQEFRYWVNDGILRKGGNHCHITKSPDGSWGTSMPTTTWNISIDDYQSESV